MSTRSRTARGLSLGLVLMVSAVAFMAAFLTAGASIFGLQFTAHDASVHRARVAAESLLAQAVYEVGHNPTFGRDGRAILKYDDHEGPPRA